MTDRLDRVLVDRGLARSRGQARELLEAGSVTVDGTVVRRASTPVGPERDVAVSDPDPWVGRGAHKLLAAFEAFGPGLDVEGARCVDVGASTGGFTQVLLARGAREVVAVDVGHGQLARPVADDPRVTDRSGTTVRGLTAADLGGPADCLVADLSFISLTSVLPDLTGLVGPGADLVLLVKPQFEVGRTRLGKGGVVRSAQDRADSLTAVLADAVDLGLVVRGLGESPVVGTTGNLEYLLWATRGGDGGWGWQAVLDRVHTLTGAVPAGRVRTPEGPRE